MSSCDYCSECMPKVVTPFVQVYRLDQHVPVLTKAYDGDAGYDLYCKEAFDLAPGQFLTVLCGFAIAIPKDWYGQIMPRSSMNKKEILVSMGVIDSGYRGELAVMLKNLSNTTYAFPEHTAIGQIVFLKHQVAVVAESDALPISIRGMRGFGSSNAQPIGTS